MCTSNLPTVVLGVWCVRTVPTTVPDKEALETALGVFSAFLLVVSHTAHDTEHCKNAVYVHIIGVLS